MIQTKSFFFATVKEVLSSIQKDIQKTGKKYSVINYKLFGNREFSETYRSDTWIIFRSNENMCRIKIEEEFLDVRFKSDEIIAVKIDTGKKIRLWATKDVLYTVISELMTS